MLTLLARNFLKPAPAPTRKPSAAKPAPKAPAPAPPHALSSAAQQLVREVSTELPELRFVMVVDASTAQVLASHHNIPAPDLPALAGAGPVLLTHLHQAAEALGEADEVIAEITVTHATELDFYKVLNQGRTFIQLRVAKQQTPLALAREALRRHAPLLVS